MKKNILLLCIVVILAVIPLIISRHAKFEGSDDQGLAAIAQLNPDYKPWVKPLWELPGKEIESLLFAVQAALGAGVIGYILGLSRGRKEKQ